jgi:hypothetical protein
MTTKRKVYFGIAIVIIVAAFYGGRATVMMIIESKIQQKIESLRAQGVGITYDSLYCNRWPCELRVKNLAVTFRSDSSCQQNRLQLSSLRIQGIALIPLIFKKVISINTIRVGKPSIQLSNNFVLHKDSTDTKGKIRRVLFTEIQFTDAHIQVYDSSDCKLIQEFNGDVELADLDIKPNTTDSVHWRIGGFTIKNLHYKLPKKFYSLSAQTIAFTALDKHLKVDSFALIPDYDKTEFMHKSRIQTDRVACTIPSLNLSGLSLDSRLQNQIKISSADVVFNFDIYRDKRYPFVKEIDTKLPVTFIYDLPIKIQINEVRIKNSKIVYEEFPEKGQSTDKAGRVFFEQLEGNIKNISTITPTIATMTAKAKFMGTGDLDASFNFPANKDGTYKAAGSLTNFDMSNVNSMLEPMAHAEIQNGILNKMSFNFVYNTYRSDGSLMMDYKDLKIASTRKNKNDEKKINEFATFLLNLFVRRDMDKSVATDKKTGDILFYRDNKKSLFNYWWKSILSGIKSVYNLDKIMDTSGKKAKQK